MGDKGIRIVSSSPDHKVVISNLNLEKEIVFGGEDGNKLHDHWINDVLWDEKMGMLVSYGHDQNVSRVMFN